MGASTISTSKYILYAQCDNHLMYVGESYEISDILRMCYHTYRRNREGIDRMVLTYPNGVRCPSGIAGMKGIYYGI